jgi:signal transduction histidine kinase
MTDALHPALRAVSDAVLGVASRRSVEEVLQQLVDHARELAGARYAALGTPDGEGGFSRFLVSGMSETLIASLGPLPRTHGLLGAMLESPDPLRTDDLRSHPRFHGWWPSGHPDMRSFLGVPIVATGTVIGAFYLTHKEGAAEFTDDDADVIALLASHAAIAMTNARLSEEAEALSVLAERNRLALDLHDAVSQKLFSLVLTAEAAGDALAGDPEAAREHVARVGALGREALEELGALIGELRPPQLERDGLDGALRKHATLLGRLHGVAIDVAVAALPAGDAGEILRVTQEAMHNAVRHAGATAIHVTLAADHVAVADDGVGFEPDDPLVRSRRLGLTSMEERAVRLGGRLEIDSVPGAGTTVRLWTSAS